MTDVPAAGHAPPPRLLEDRVAVVTGGAGGIGRGITELFAVHGARVVVVDIDGARTAETVAAVAAAGGDALGHVADVTDPDAAPAVVAATLATFGRIDVLVNDVGHFLFPGRSFVDTTPDEWLALYRVNLEHVLRMTQATLPPMIERGAGGSIINLTTVEAFRGIPQHPVYAAFKAGVTQFGRSLALDVGRHRIRVNDIAPDVTRSLQLPYERWLSPDDEHRIPTWVPLGRLGEAGDAAGVALFLASDLGAFVTGTTVHCDGGTHAAGGWYRSQRDGRGWTNRPFDP
jgi:NAD(P)-dependent dehydrogenase (short-subunit alcohol dehydrogenase family)